MKKKYWLIIYLLVLASEIIAVQLDNYVLQTVFKPILMPLLAAWFIAALKINKNRLKSWVMAALFFSWTGDILLLLQEKNSIFFLTGLVSFLLAHICYIIFFHKVRLTESIKANPWLLLLVVIYYAGLIIWMNPYLGEMKLPVRVYGIVISFMFMLAMHMLYLKNKPAGRFMMTGALLFLISDSALAINKFYRPFEGAGIVIMFTYGLAQLLIVYGAMNYIRGQQIKIIKD